MHFRRPKPSLTKLISRRSDLNRFYATAPPHFPPQEPAHNMSTSQCYPMHWPCRPSSARRCCQPSPTQFHALVLIQECTVSGL